VKNLFIFFTVIGIVSSTRNYAQFIDNGSSTYTEKNVGIGIPSPQSIIHIRNISDGADQWSGIRMNPATSVDGIHNIFGFRCQGLRLAGGQVGTVTKSQILLQDRGISFGTYNASMTEKMVILNSGQVGIGTEDISNESATLVVKTRDVGNSYHVAQFFDKDLNRRFTFNTVSENKFSFYVYNESESKNEKLYLGSLYDEKALVVNGETGQVGIGTSTFSADYKLAVDGKIIAEGMKIEMSESWPDYVFASSYNLRPLSEVKTFIEENSHLPEVPSAQDVEENGVDVGQMDAILLQKIEEMTLYMIQLEEKNARLENKNAEFEKRLSELETKK